MELNTLIKERLFPILQKEGFKLSEEFKNIIRFKSSTTQINIVYNEYEKSNFIEIGKKDGPLYPLTDSVIKSVFNSELRIDQVPPDIFLKNLALLFEQSKGIEMLNGNITDIANFVEQESGEYTFKLIQRQILEVASKAWEIKDYKTFIENIDKLDLDKVPQSFQVKYRIAKQKL